ncbi:MAG: hypothetical protein KatS3mg111_2863 [Pirellulaceae bacterium]|nr:MAG: hypothetical protein KatS3mg111_2863 [Pirellulaceae bacterium]
MYRILLVATFPVEHLLRQTPGGSGVWGACQFVSEPDGGPCDAVVVYDNCPRPIECYCAPENTLLITGEPPSLRRYRRPFTAQFGHVWTSHRQIDHPGVRYGAEGQPWHYGLYASQVHGRPLNYTDLENLPPPRKTKLCSVICSTKSTTTDHRQRLAFIERLRAEFGEQIDIFGRGMRPVRDKADAIYAYRYHLALENDHSPFYMTEKLTDAFLGWSYPLYFGGEEAQHWFPTGSFLRLDIHQPDIAVGMVRDMLQHDLTDEQRNALDSARRIVLQRANIMARLAEFWPRALVAAPPRRLRILPKRCSTQLAFRYWTHRLSSPRRSAA